jgi:hypothetical protein
VLGKDSRASALCINGALDGRVDCFESQHESDGKRKDRHFYRADLQPDRRSRGTCCGGEVDTPIRLRSSNVAKTFEREGKAG